MDCGVANGDIFFIRHHYIPRLLSLSLRLRNELLQCIHTQTHAVEEWKMCVKMFKFHPHSSPTWGEILRRNYAGCGLRSYAVDIHLEAGPKVIMGTFSNRHTHTRAHKVS